MGTYQARKKRNKTHKRASTLGVARQSYIVNECQDGCSSPTLQVLCSHSEILAQNGAYNFICVQRGSLAPEA